MKKNIFIGMFIGLLCISTNAQTTPGSSSFTGSRTTNEVNQKQTSTSLQELVIKYQNLERQGASISEHFTTAEQLQLKSYFSSQNTTANRAPEAQLLSEGFDDITTLPGAGFTFVNVSDDPNIGWNQGSTAVFDSHSGAPTSYISVNYNSSSGTVINNFMITPVLSLKNGDEVSFWTRTSTASTYPDRLEVRVDPTGTDTDPTGPTSVGSYTQLLLEINPNLTVGGYPDVWTKQTAVISGLTGTISTRVAFRYWVTGSGTNANYIGIDSLSIDEGAGGGFPAPYCGPLNFSSDVEPITLVEVAGISNVTSAALNGTPSHEDFTAIEGTMEVGGSYPIALEGNTDGGYTNRFVVFIDWNQNGVLDDAGEVYEITDLLVGSTGTDGQQSIGTIDVPAGALVGATRMRVKKQFGSSNYLDPCLATGYGQAEDYTINVTPVGGGFPAPYCGPLDSFAGDVEPITLVEVAGISNVSSPVMNATPPHEDFTAIEGTMSAGGSYPIALEGNTDGDYTNRFVVFIDWNQNGILDDAGEVYEIIETIENSTGTDGKQATAIINVPVNAVVGATRMRVKKQYGTSNYLDPCLGAGYGQAEDYTINVDALGVSDNTITGFSYYPNPTNAFLNLNSVDNIEHVSIYNLLGQVVIENRIDATKAQIDVSGLPIGTYLMKVSVNGVIGTYRVLKK